jgi:hypothetical protein
MTVRAKDIKWGNYSLYEGPVYWGSDEAEFLLPHNPTRNDEILAVIAATEGGAFNAVNMYDSCYCSVGLVQWCEGGQFSVSDMLGETLSVLPYALDAFREPMRRVGATFDQNFNRQWRFFLDGNEVNRRSEQRRLFFLKASGRKGTWDAESVSHAREWALGFAELFSEPRAQTAQKSFTVRKLREFARPFARDLMNRAPDTAVGKAFEPAYLSFAVNNPTWADRYLRQACATTEAPPFSLQWLSDVLERLTKGPQKTIYPHRYRAIRPVLKDLFGVTIPNAPGEPVASDGRKLMTTREIQALLDDLGYDLGESGPEENGVDGRWGKKSASALCLFEQKHQLDLGLIPDGWPDERTNAALGGARYALSRERTAGKFNHWFWPLNRCFGA